MGFCSLRKYVELWVLDGRYNVVVVVGSYCFYCYEKVYKVTNNTNNRYFLTYELTNNYNKNQLQ